MLRVLVLVDHARGISGPHRNVVGSLNALSKREDVQLRLLCREIDEQEPYAQAAGIEIRVGYDPHDPRRLAGNIPRVLSAARNCDVIYVPSGLKSLLYAQVARMRRRLVAGPNVTPLPNWKRDSPSRIELRLLCDTWIENSRERGDHVAHETGAQVPVVHHAIDTNKWGPHRHNPAIWKKFNVPGARIRLLYVGHDKKAQKGVAQLLDAFQVLQSSYPIGDLQLIMAGALSQPTLDRIKGMTSVYPLGFLEADVLPEIYATCDISIVPSSWESFSFTTLEALASGIAMVASRTGGIPEQVVDGDSGRLVQIADQRSIYLPDAPQRLAAAITELATDPQLRARLALGARKRALAAFSEARLGQNLVDVFTGRMSP
jgi:glycosyltransferase involved in cell wall biosynthesis